MDKANTLSRRDFVKSSLAVAAMPAGMLQGSSQARKRLKFSAMVTMGDWAVFDGTWGEPGVYYILDRMKKAGFSRVYWRTTDGCGQSCYPSRVTNPAQQFIRDSRRFPEQKFIVDFLKLARPTSTEWLQGYVDFGKFDSVKTARYWAKRLGLEFYCWHEHAEDHGAVGQPSKISVEHPEWLTKNRDGKRSHCRFSMAFEPALNHRLGLVMEVLQYEPDGIFFDFTKSMEGTPGVGCTAHFDPEGVWYCGYVDPILSAFKEKTGRDPYAIPNDDTDWVRFRANYLTNFIRKVRQMQREFFPNVKIGLFGCPTGRPGLASNDKVIPLADPLRAYLEDHELWTSEGLLDEFVNAYTVGCPKPEAYEAMIRDSRSRVRPPCTYNGSQLEVYCAKKKEDILQGARIASQLGCKEIVFFETTPLEHNHTWEAAKEVIREYGV